MVHASLSLVFFSVLLGLVIYVNAAYAIISPFQEERKSNPLKVVVSLHYTENQFKQGIGHISISYQDSDGFKEIKYYNFDKMMQRDPLDPVKIKAKFPRNTIMDYEDYLVCVTTLNNHHDN